MAKLNEEIIGGLISALSRGEGLEKAMMTFYNAGYEKEEIEDCAKEVYTKLGPKAMGVKEGALQDRLDDIATKAGVPKTEKPKEKTTEKREDSSANDNLVLQAMPEKDKTQLEEQKKDSPQQTQQQGVSTYGSGNNSPQYKNDSEITSKIEEAIKGLRPVNIPSKIEIVHKNEDSKPQVIQHVSNYADSPKAPSKIVTYILIAILVLLLGALVAVFLFKEDLIKLFNDLGLG